MASDVKVNFVGDNSDLKRAVDSSDRELDGFSKNVGKYGAAIAVGFAGAAVGAGVALYGMAEAAAEDEKAQKALAKTIQNVTGATAEQAANIENWITKQGKSLGVTDDQLRPALDSLVRSFGDVDAATEMATLAMDISAATGKDLTSVSDALGKAYNGQLGPLKKLDPALAGIIKEGATADQVFADLSKTFEGQAAGAAETTAGKLNIAKIQFAEMQEEIGAKVIPILADLATWMVEDVIPALEKTSAWIDENIVPALQRFAGWLNENVVPALQATGVWLRDDLAPAIADVARWIDEYIIPAVVKFAGFINDHVIPAIQKVIGWYVQWIGFLIKVGTEVAALGVKVYNFAVDVVTIFTNIIEFVRGMPGQIKEAARGMWDGITDAFKAAINSIIRSWNAFELGFSWGGKDMPGPIPDIPGFDIKIGTPNIPYLASGGVVSGPMSGFPAMLHGTEAVIPLNSPRAAGMFGGPQTIILQLNGREVARALTEDQRAGGEPVYVKLAAR